MNFAAISTPSDVWHNFLLWHCVIPYLWNIILLNQKMCQVRQKSYLWFGEMELYLKLVQNNYLLPWNLKKKILQLHAEREL